MPSSYVVQANLAFQIIILSLLLASLIFKKRRIYLLHGSIMLIATSLNAFSIMLVMWPSFLNLTSLVVDNPLNPVSVVAVTHGILGAVAEILAISVLTSWRLRRSTRYCARKRTTMRATLMLWLMAAFSGFLLYGFLYMV